LTWQDSVVATKDGDGKIKLPQIHSPTEDLALMRLIDECHLNPWVRCLTFNIPLDPRRTFGAQRFPAESCCAA